MVRRSSIPIPMRSMDLPYLSMIGMSNCSDFILKKEDHTIGNLLSEHLKQAPHVLMAGYKSKYCSKV